MFLKKIKPLKKNTDHCHKEECDQQKKKRNHLLLYKILLSTKSWEQLRCSEYRVNSHKNSGMRESSHMSGKSLTGQPKPRPGSGGARAKAPSAQHAGFRAISLCATDQTLHRTGSVSGRARWALNPLKDKKGDALPWKSNPVMAGEGIFIA